MSSVFVLALGLALIPGRGSAADVTGIGLKGGLNVATLHGGLPTDFLFDNSVRYGVGAGLSLNVRVAGLSLQPEMLYVTKGTSLGRGDVSDASGVPIGTYELIEAVNYLELPILVRLDLPSYGLVAPYLLMGPAVGLRLSQKLAFTGDANGSIDVDLFRSADLGLALGPGLTLGRGRLRGTLDARYTLGLTTATRDSYSRSARNGSLLVMTGVVLAR